MKKLLLFILLVCIKQVNAQIITTIAGNGTAGYIGDGGPATAAAFNTIVYVSLDATGNLFISDLGNYCIRKLSTSGIITTIAGDGSGGYSGDGGPATSAQLYQPRGLTFDALGNMYIADSWNHCIRIINTSGIINTIAGNGTQGFSGDGGQATGATLNNPYAMAFDPSGNMYIADKDNNRIRKVNVSGVITTIAGTGVAGFSGDGGAATIAKLNSPTSLAIDAVGNLYIADDGNNRIRMLNTSGIITTIAGINTSGNGGDGGPATSAELDGITEITFDTQGDLFIAGYYNHAIRMINTSGIINTVAGNGSPNFSGDGGPATAAEISYPNGVAIDAIGNMYIAEWGDNRIRFVCSAPDTISGLITEPNTTPVTGGQVYVYRQNLIHAGLLDTAGFTSINTNGTYTFSSLPAGNYFVQAVASPSYTNAVSTYYSNKADNYRWDSAIFVTHNGCASSHFTGYNITIIETPAQTGTGIISGTVTAIVGYGQKLSGGNNTIMGAPLKGVDIKLGKNPGGCAARTSTDPAGTYTFTNVDTGSYFVYVDIPNFGMDTILKVHLTLANPTSLNNDYCVDSVKVAFCSFATTGVEQLRNKNKELIIYPNPSTCNIIIQSSTEICAIIIYNSLGEIVLQTKSKNVQEQIDVSKLSVGIYTLLAQGKYLKLIKE